MTKSREKIISQTSILCIIVNIILSTIKIIIGILASSMAIISEGINNTSDALSSIITLIGNKLANKHPTKNHPFGFGRIEYITSLIIAAIILFAGYSMITSSIEGIIKPEPLDITIISIIIVVVSCIIKFFLGIYTIKMGKLANSEALIGVGTECRNDSFISIVTIASSILYLTTSINIDSYAGAITSLLIIKAGIEVLLHTFSDIIGTKGDKELANKLLIKIKSTPNVITAADMILHNYGPDRWSGSCNIELDHKLTVGEVYKVIHQLQLDIMHEYNVVLVFGIYAVDKDNEKSKILRQKIGEFVKQEPNILGFHALYIDESTNTIYLDFTVDYELKNWEELKERFIKYISEYYPEYKLELTIETDFV